MKIDDFFLKFTDKLAYLDLKKEAADKLGVSVTMPIRVSDFSQGIKKGEFDDHIDASLFAKGIIWNLAIDPNFIYADEYKRVIKNIVKKPADMAIQMGMDAIEKNDETSALIAFRAACILDENNKFAKLQYGNLLWRMEDLDEDTKNNFIKKASSLFEEALRIDDKDPLINLSLAQLNEYLGNFNKALAYYQVALSEGKTDDFNDGVRDAMRGIENEADLEDAIYHMRKADYGCALDHLIALGSKSDRWDVDYYSGLCKQNLSDYKGACQSFNKALEKGGNLEDVYNGLVYNYTALGEEDMALIAANSGLKAFPEALRIRFNRAILLFQKGKNKEALEDLDYILAYQDLSDEFFNQIMMLKEEINRGPAI